MKDFWVSSSCLSRQELIAYLDGQLGEEARYRVENHLLDCEFCSTAVEGLTQTQTSTTTVLADLADLDARLAATAFSLPPQSPPQPRLKVVRRWLSPWHAAAAAAIIGLLALGWHQYHKYSLPLQLYHAYFDPYPMHGVVVTRTGYLDLPPDASSALSEALGWYHEERYSKALLIFLQYLKKNPTQEQIRLMAGLSAMALGEPAEAAELLLPLTLSNNEFLVKEATWYIGLCAIRQAHWAEGRQWLERIAQDTSSEYHQQAAELASQLPKK